MRYTHLCPDGRVIYCDCELNLTYIVFGQRDETSEREKLPPKEKVITDPLEQEAAFKFHSDARRGWYAWKALAWCESGLEADAVVARFKAEGRINIKVVEINQARTLTHA